MHPIVFGEVLFDVFPDGTAVLGGAPFNVAWHLQGFGLKPTFISQVGNDTQGQQVLSAMQDWNMNSEQMHIDPNHPTGTVSIELDDDGVPDFSILPNQAYDHIAQTTASPEDLIYHGSLIARSPASNNTLQQLTSNSDGSIFVDINLRAPWWEQSQCLGMLKNARWAKLNEDELAVLTDQEELRDDKLREVAQRFSAQYDLELLIITLGADGAFIVDGRQITESPPVQVNHMADTVGAGDAFSSVVITGIRHNWNVDTMLSRATQFAATVCEQQGATANNLDLYRLTRESWNV